MNIVHFGMLVFFMNLFLVSLLGMTESQSQSEGIDREGRIITATEKFGLEEEELQEISQREDSGTLDEVQSYLAIGKGIGNIGAFIKATITGEFKTYMTQYGGNATLLALILFMWNIVVFAVVTGFIIERLKR